MAELQAKQNGPNVPTKVLVSFRTDLPEHKVDEAPLTVDSKSDPTVLSKIIVELLGKEEDQTLYRFKLNEKFLRGSLKSHLIAFGGNGEETIDLKYDLHPMKPQLVKNEE